VFKDRVDAGRRLGAVLADGIDPPVVVLGVARGGVVVAAEVAAALGAPLDVVIPRKLGAPGNPELGIGAVAPGVRVVDRSIVDALGVSEGYIESEAARQEAEIERRTAAFREGRAARDLSGATVVVVDDGVATGVTALAALRWARVQGAAEVVFAAPVGPVGVEHRLADSCDRCVVLLQPPNLMAVGQWYERFEQVTDDEVRAVLRLAETPE
jgi:predicted phosphoribosyltransferase